MADPPSPDSLDELAELPTLVSDEPPPVADEPAVGERIGRFEVRRVLGAGGMGVVVSARDPQLERKVAIKLVRSTGSGAQADEVKARLLREARAMAQLRHPNIVSVYEVGEHADQIYVAMEEVEGGTLRAELARLRSRQPPPGWQAIVALFAEAGRGLAAAHDAGMVHRDFKPDNVFIDADGRVLVGDFGIVGSAGVQGPRTGEEPDLFAHQLTRADEVLGTPVYMPPEQHAGDPIDARADQFSFCVALYEALCGQLPFPGDSRAAYLEAIARSDIKPPPAGRRLPEWLMATLRRGLAADPADRFPSMRELLVELGAEAPTTNRLGGAERTVVIVGVGCFVVAWALAVLGLRVELSYALHYITDFGFVALVAAFGWFAREAIARSELNRKMFGFLVANAISIVVLVVGCQLAGLSASTVGALHMLLFGAITTFAVTQFGWRVAPMAACYFACFMGASAWPSLFLPLLLTAHSVATITGVAVFRVRGPVAVEPPSKR